MAAAAVFRGIAAINYFNAALGTGAVEVLASPQSSVRNAADLGSPGARYPSHARITNSHATQYAGALVADSGTVVLSSGNFSVIIPPLNTVVVPLSQAMRVSIIASAANTIVSVEFGTIG